MKLDFNIPMTKSDGCIMIRSDNWQDNTSQLIQAYTMKGERNITYLNKVLAVNYLKDVYYENIKEGDLVFITRTASRISYLKPFKLPKKLGKYANVHLLQVIGKFEDGEISVKAFTPIYDKVFMKPVKVDMNSVLYQDNSSTTIGKVIKTGKGGFNPDWTRRGMEIREGQTVLLRDNITTKLNISGEDYIATEDSMVIGYFKDGSVTMENLELFDNNVILEEYNNEKITGSSLLKPPLQDDITELYKNYEFKVLKTGPLAKKVKTGDKVIIERDKTDYVTFFNKKYYIIKGTKDLMAIFE